MNNQNNNPCTACGHEQEYHSHGCDHACVVDSCPCKAYRSDTAEPSGELGNDVDPSDLVESASCRHCAVEACGRKYHGRGYCRMHLARLARWGSLGPRRIFNGRSLHPLYSTYWNMKQRCSNSNSDTFKNYGGRGIKVCDRWLESFENFLADMGERPGPEYSLERKNNDLGYSPENCKWATKSEQNNNMRANKTLTFNGETLTQAQWAARVGITPTGLKWRIKQGWPLERILSKENKGERL